MTSIALLFPGQGSQEAGMGRHEAESHPHIMDLWKQAEKSCGHALREIYWDGDTASMADTIYLQPALTVVNLGLWTLLSSHCRPIGVAGHSLGEYSALAAAQVLPLSTIIDLVCLRGRLMSEADPQGCGTMAAVLRLDAATVAACVDEARKASGEELVIANYNTPTQFVASGTQQAIATLQETVKQHKGRALPLAVSGAFHSPLLKDAAKEMEHAINSLPKTVWNDPRFPVYCNSTGQQVSTAVQIRTELCRQMTSSVYWIDTIQNMYRANARTFIECGPKQVLSRMLDPILEGLPEAQQDSVVHATATYNIQNLEQAMAFCASHSFAHCDNKDKE